MKTHTSSSPLHEGDHAATDLGELCELLDNLRAEVALLDAVGLHEAAGRLEVYEKLVRQLVYTAISDVCAPAA